MKTIHGHAKTFTALLLSGALSGLIMMPVCNSAPKTPAKRGKSKAPAAKGSSMVRLKRHAFPDVTMGVPAAYTMLLPPGWTAKGKIDWQPVGEVPFPQRQIEINSPQKGRISYEPLITINYMESPGMAPQGIPAPANFPQWLAQTFAAANPNYKNVKLVKSTRDTKMEEFIQKMDLSTGGGQGMEREVHIITLEYNEGNLRRREEMNVTYVRFQPYLSQNLNSQMWSIGHNGSISAPAAQFEAQRKPLMAVANTIRQTPHWYTHSQALIAAMSRQRVANSWELIKQRGQQISQMSDAQYAKYKKDMAGGDEAQRKRINSIYETEDFKDSNGNIVNLPIHYNHVFSDGKGNYVLSNNSQDKPGAGWKSIRPYK